MFQDQCSKGIWEEFRTMQPKEDGLGKAGRLEGLKIAWDNLHIPRIFS